MHSALVVVILTVLGAASDEPPGNCGCNVKERISNPKRLPNELTFNSPTFLDWNSSNSRILKLLMNFKNKIRYREKLQIGRKSLMQTSWYSRL